MRWVEAMTAPEAISRLLAKRPRPSAPRPLFAGHPMPGPAELCSHARLAELMPRHSDARCPACRGVRLGSAAPAATLSPAPAHQTHPLPLGRAELFGSSALRSARVLAEPHVADLTAHEPSITPAPHDKEWLAPFATDWSALSPCRFEDTHFSIRQPTEVDRSYSGQRTPPNRHARRPSGPHLVPQCPSSSGLGFLVDAPKWTELEVRRGYCRAHQVQINAPKLDPREHKGMC